MKKTILKISGSLFIVLLLISCDKTQIFDQYYTFKDGWDKKNSVHFKFEQKASKKAKNLFINIRNNNEYKFSNFFMIVKLESPSGKTTVDTLEYQMANPDGTLLGNGFSDIKESKLWYKENYIFTETGKYKLQMEQAVRETGKINGIQKLEGVTELGFRIESIQK